MKSKLRKGKKKEKWREGQGELGSRKVRSIVVVSICIFLNFSTYDVRCCLFNVDSYCNMAEWHNITHKRLNVES